MVVRDSAIALVDELNDISTILSGAADLLSLQASFEGDDACHLLSRAIGDQVGRLGRVKRLVEGLVDAETRNVVSQ